MLQILLSGLGFVAQNLFNNRFSHRFRRGLLQLGLLNGIGLGVGSLALLILFRPGLPPVSAIGYICAFGVLFVATISAMSETFSRGPMGMSSLIIDMSVVVSVLFGLLVWHEPLTKLRGLALALLAVSLALISLPEKKETTPVRRGWLPVALTAMLLNGSLYVIEKAAFTAVPELTSTDFTFWTMAAGFAFCLLLVIVLTLTGRRLEKGESLRSLAPVAAGFGLGTAGGYFFHAAALKALPSIVVIPAVVGLNVALLMVCSIVFYKERLSPRKAAAFLLGMAGVLLLNL